MGGISLGDLWFVIVAIFWVGFFVLEGFDFGVGMLHSFLGRNDLERRVLVNTIGPVWDGNEVWLIVAGRGDLRRLPGLVRHHVLGPLPGRGDPAGRAHGARASPSSTSASSTTHAGAVLALGPDRSAARSSRSCSGWRSATCSTACPSTARTTSPGNFFDLLTPFGLWTGLTLLVLSLLMGATYLTLKTTGELHDRAQKASAAIGVRGHPRHVRVHDVDPRRPQHRLRPQAD